MQVREVVTFLAEPRQPPIASHLLGIEAAE
jgi:hypothetical protein